MTKLVGTATEIYVLVPRPWGKTFVCVNDQCKSSNPYKGAEPFNAYRLIGDDSVCWQDTGNPGVVYCLWCGPPT